MNMFKGSDAKTVEEYLALVPEGRQKMVRTVHEAIEKAVPELKPWIMSGMIGYGVYRFKSKSGQTGDWSLIALANRKDYVSVYVCAVGPDGAYIAEKNRERLGKVSVGKSCIRFKKLDDLNLDVLLELCKEAETLGGIGNFTL